jgi:endogenous inhibitor of DNA gyrase (YacG/DUF329 family)
MAVRYRKCFNCGKKGVWKQKITGYPGGTSERCKYCGTVHRATIGKGN